VSALFNVRLLFVMESLEQVSLSLSGKPGAESHELQPTKLTGIVLAK
jgi:hypothetical protein